MSRSLVPRITSFLCLDSCLRWTRDGARSRRPDSRSGSSRASFSLLLLMLTDCSRGAAGDCDQTDRGDRLRDRRAIRSLLFFPPLLLVSNPFNNSINILSFGRRLVSEGLVSQKEQ